MALGMAILTFPLISCNHGLIITSHLGGSGAWIWIAFLGRGRRLKVPLRAWFNMDSMWPWYISSDGGNFSVILVIGSPMNQ